MMVATPDLDPLFEKAVVELIWDTDRAVKQALRHTDNKTREPDGKLYDTCIRTLLKPLWDETIAKARIAAIEALCEDDTCANAGFTRGQDLEAVKRAICAYVCTLTTPVQRMTHPIREKLEGVTSHHDALTLIEVVDGLEAISHYNHEIMGYTPGLQQLPEIGQHIHYGGNAYYVLNQLRQRGFCVTDHDDHC